MLASRIMKNAVLTAMIAFLLLPAGCLPPKAPALSMANSANHPMEQASGNGISSGGKEVKILLPGGLPLEMVWVPTGTYMMGRTPDEQGGTGTEWPQHKVTVPGFWMGKYEVTQAQWRAVMNTNRSFFSGDNRPVEVISWNEMKSFISVLNAHIAATGQGPSSMRLPSEAEWEHACRAGTTTRYYWGDDPDCSQIDSHAWYLDNSNEQTHDVGTKKPNALGLYDMSGNLWEYCEDDFHPNYEGAPTDGSAWIDSPRSSRRVVRGGGWYYPSDLCGSMARTDEHPAFAGNDLGFRLAR